MLQGPISLYRILLFVCLCLSCGACILDPLKGSLLANAEPPFARERSSSERSTPDTTASSEPSFDAGNTDRSREARPSSERDEGQIQDLTSEAEPDGGSVSPEGPDAAQLPDKVPGPCLQYCQKWQFQASYCEPRCPNDQKKAELCYHSCRNLRYSHDTCVVFCTAIRPRRFFSACPNLCKQLNYASGVCRLHCSTHSNRRSCWKRCRSTQPPRTEEKCEQSCGPVPPV